MCKITMWELLHSIYMYQIITLHILQLYMLYVNNIPIKWEKGTVTIQWESK